MQYDETLFPSSTEILLFNQFTQATIPLVRKRLLKVKEEFRCSQKPNPQEETRDKPLFHFKRSERYVNRMICELVFSCSLNSRWAVAPQMMHLL